MRLGFVISMYDEIDTVKSTLINLKKSNCVTSSNTIRSRWKKNNFRIQICVINMKWCQILQVIDKNY